MCAYEAKGCQAVHMRRGARRWLKRVVVIEMCTHAATTKSTQRRLAVSVALGCHAQDADLAL